MCKPSVILIKLYDLYTFTRNRRFAHRFADEFLAICFLARAAPGLLPRAGRPGSPGAVSSHAPLSPEAGLPFPTARSGCRSCLWRALLGTLRPRMSNGSLQKVQFSEDDGRNNVAMQAALPAATNIKMMQGLELKSQVHKGVHGWEK